MSIIFIVLAAIVLLFTIFVIVGAVVYVVLKERKK